MENFEELVEQYLNDEEIKEKRMIDAEIETVEKCSKRKKETNFFKTISISDFVYYYLGTDHDCKNLKHKGLKSFNNPYVVGVSNEFAIKNPDCIKRNEIIVVIDSYGNPGTYINPNLLKNIEDVEEYKNLLNIFKYIHINDLSESGKLYGEYMKIITRMSELEQSYIDGCDLLDQLQKKSLLRQIRKYSKEATKKINEFNEKQNEILNILGIEDIMIDRIQGKKQKRKGR